MRNLSESIANTLKLRFPALLQASSNSLPTSPEPTAPRRTTFPKRHSPMPTNVASRISNTTEFFILSAQFQTPIHNFFSPGACRAIWELILQITPFFFLFGAHASSPITNHQPSSVSTKEKKKLNRLSLTLPRQPNQCLLTLTHLLSKMFNFHSGRGRSWLSTTS